MEAFLLAMEENEVHVRVLVNHQGDLMILISAGEYIFECLVPEDLPTHPLTEAEQTLLLACINLMEVLVDLSQLTNPLVRCLAYSLNCNVMVCCKRTLLSRNHAVFSLPLNSEVNIA
jgi:hypothetical protein